jgi:MOSC domain-containing protein YiiM
VSPGRIVQISVSPSGVPKRAVPSARITTGGVEGDGHRAVPYHGGPERAVCVYALEAIRALQAEGHAVVPGALGENVTLEGVPWGAVTPGRRLLLGDGVLLEVTRYTTPCRTIMRAFKDRAYGRVSHTRHPGWSRVYTRVLTEGVIAAGDPVRLLEPAVEERRGFAVARRASGGLGGPSRPPIQKID